MKPELVSPSQAASGPELVSPSQATSRIAAFGRARDRNCRVEVQEKRAFKDGWLCLGTVSLWPTKLNDEDEQRDAEPESTAFEWRLPTAGQVESELASLLGVKQDDHDYAKISRALDQTASIAVRAGLLSLRRFHG